MHKSITFLENVKPTSRQKVLNFVKEWKSELDFIVVNTSGSTGKPKQIKLKKSSIKASAKATISFFNLKPNQTILLALSPDYIAGKMMIVRAIEHNLNIIVAPFTSNPLLSNYKEKIHFSAFVPMQIEAILKNPKSRINYKNIDQVIIGGAKINTSLENKIQNLSNLSYATFGMTETISHIALRNISKNESHYSALPKVTFSVNSKNCLLINAKFISSSKIETNDIVKLINQHQFIWLGRADFIINSGGIKFNPEKIEQKIEHLLPLVNFYIGSLPCEKLGEKLILYIESESPVKITKLQQDLKLELSKYEMPKDIITVSKFKLTNTGKIIRYNFEKK